MGCVSGCVLRSAARPSSSADETWSGSLRAGPTRRVYALGRLPWLAFECLRSRLLRPRFAMMDLRLSGIGWVPVCHDRPTTPESLASALAASAPQGCGSIERQQPERPGPPGGDIRGTGVKMAEDVRAEIVASVLEVVVSEGDQIGEGDTLVLLESMKMEIPVLAEVAGTVSKVSVSVGDVIQAGDLIAVIS